jgi:hypothetical protein
VPATTFGVSTNFAFAKFLASRSFGNVSVALASARFPGGSSNETNHVPWDLLAMGSKPWSSAFNRHRRHNPGLAGGAGIGGAGQCPEAERPEAEAGKNTS